MNEQLHELWHQFRAVWPADRVRSMSLEEYTLAGNKETFIYWMESRLDKLGSIWGGSSFKFGIYSRSDRGPRENVGGRVYSENYAWMRKYGDSEKEAFENIRLLIVEVIDAVHRNELERIDQIDLGGAYKWKIAFHYQQSLESPVCINIFRRRVLELAADAAPGTPLSAIQRKILQEWDGTDILQYTRELWTKFGRDLPATPEQFFIPEDTPEPEPEDKAQPTVNAHTEVQYLLLRLGNDMGFDVWAARNDRNKQHEGESFAAIPRIRASLPLQFDPQTNKTIELIDVLWLKGNSIVAAFEIESTTSIYSGLLRMSDLITMQPNLTIPLYLVAPDERRDKVMAEINRPTFARHDPPIYELCRYISFSRLKAEVEQIRPIIKFIKPEYLKELSESCAPEEL